MTIPILRLSCLFVIPAEAGIQALDGFSFRYLWIPAYAGMTKRRVSLYLIPQE